MKRFYKSEDIEERIASLEKSLNNAKAYLERGENVEGEAWFHFDDWKGNSGHPKWVKNKMIPTLEKEIVNQERILKVLESKEKDKLIHMTKVINPGNSKVYDIQEPIN